MMNRHTFRLGNNCRKLQTVKADDYDHAAVIAARKIYGSNNLCVIRISGHMDFCGYFQAYTFIATKKGKVRRLVGDPFYVQMVFNQEITRINMEVYNRIQYVHVEV